ncbi:MULTISPECIES: hypothetical protein [Brevibacterium]|uniref:Uncharacterized protein n=1 Tax=Brevibacterium casei TaxID=33889 RepID=A0A7T4DJN9_9MICO|nr:hypothetical protein [Brevibacterium casei]QQB14586.1 hypothetical protein I6H47_00865 [Brevibacterium casei]
MELSLPADLLGILMILFAAASAVLIIALMIVGLRVLIRVDRRLGRQLPHDAAPASGTVAAPDDRLLTGGGHRA